MDDLIFYPVIPAEAGIQRLSDGANHTNVALFCGSDVGVSVGTAVAVTTMIVGSGEHAVTSAAIVIETIATILNIRNASQIFTPILFVLFAPAGFKVAQVAPNLTCITYFIYTVL